MRHMVVSPGYLLIVLDKSEDGLTEGQRSLKTEAEAKERRIHQAACSQA